MSSQIVGLRIVRPRKPHEEYETRDAHPIGIFQNLRGTLLSRVAGNSGEMAMQIPDHVLSDLIVDPLPLSRLG